MTTERRVGLTVQNRLTITVAVLSVLTLSIVGLILYTVESNNVSGRITASMSQEIDEMRTFSENGIDPQTGRPFTSVDEILSNFLAQNRPDEDEVLFSFLTDGRVLYQGEPKDLLGSSSAFEEAVAGAAEKGGEIRLTVGDVEYEGFVLPITGTEAATGTNTDTQAAPTDPTDRTEGVSEVAGGAAATNGVGAFVVVHNVTASHADLGQIMQIYVVVALAATLLIAGLSSLLARRLLSPVTELRRTAQSISGGDLSSRLETKGHDDIAELGHTFNDMLDRLEAAFEAQRRFLDDVGHELRTPLTILGGHLETMNAEDVGDVEETRAMLLDETDRMGRLVEELLLLARARRPDFVRFAEVDLSGVVSDSLAKAKGSGTGNGASRCRIAELHGDRRALRGAPAAGGQCRRTHRDGQVIVFGARDDAESVHIWVRDEGEGVPDEIAEDIFDRFCRGSTDGAGFGLGCRSFRHRRGAWRQSRSRPDLHRCTVPHDPAERTEVKSILVIEDEERISAFISKA